MGGLVIISMISMVAIDVEVLKNGLWWVANWLSETFYYPRPDDWLPHESHRPLKKYQSRHYLRRMAVEIFQAYGGTFLRSNAASQILVTWLNTYNSLNSLLSIYTGNSSTQKPMSELHVCLSFAIRRRHPPLHVWLFIKLMDVPLAL
jgi:hypothetical protein